MGDLRHDIRHLIASLQRRLPLPARVATPLATVRAGSSNAKRSSRCLVTQIYDAGDRLGLMCQLQFEDKADETAIFVASIMRLSFDRKCSISRELAAYQKLRRERCVAASAVAGRFDAADNLASCSSLPSWDAGGVACLEPGYDEPARRRSV